VGMSISGFDDISCFRQCVVWCREQRPPRNGTTKIVKPPYTPGTAHRPSAGNPETWDAHGEDIAHAGIVRAGGVGFVFTADDSFFGIDLDEVRNREIAC